MTIVRYLKLCLPLLLLSACSASLPALAYNPAATVDTLSAAVSLSVSSADISLSGSGFLLYHRPDQLHLVVLSPFGTTMMEVFAQGERITLLYPGSSTAYVGRVDELPASGGLQGWRMMRWVMDASPATSGGFSGTIDRTAVDGRQESVSYTNGLVTVKKNLDGDQVYYSRYAVVNGAPLAAEIDLRNSRNDQVRLVLDEPEVNTPLEPSVFMPKLDGLTVLPLSALKGL